MESPCTFRNWSLIVLIVGGVTSSVFLGIVMLQKGGKVASVAPVAFILSLFGLAPLCHAAAAIYVRNPKEGKRNLKIAKALELVFEALPQATVQAYVMVAEDKFNWADNPDKFDRGLAVSLGLSIFVAGSTLYGLEAEARKEGHDVPQLNALTRYGFVATLARTVQVGALVFGVALNGCTWDALNAGLAMFLVILCVLAVGLFEPVVVRRLMGPVGVWMSLTVYVIGVGGLRYYWTNGRSDNDGLRGPSANTDANQRQTGQSCATHSECYAGYICDISGDCSACTFLRGISDSSCTIFNFLIDCDLQYFRVVQQN